jgi:protein-S-isoprenylcysteine O-methyltransferase Ste14
MLSELLTAYFLVAFLAIFSTANLLNAIRTVLRQNRKKGRSSSPEVKPPNPLHLAFAVLGTFAFFLEAAAHPLYVLLRLPCQLEEYDVFRLPFQHSVYLQILGALLILIGCILFLWSILERGRQRNIGKLVTWGPFKYVRHPSYLGYLLMFMGLPLLLFNLTTLVPLIAIPGYASLAKYEEQLLIQRFGDEYVEYQKKTGRFTPRP